jgi:hypothetical protein
MPEVKTAERYVFSVSGFTLIVYHRKRTTTEGRSHRYRSFKGSTLRRVFAEHGSGDVALCQQLLLPVALHRMAKGFGVLKGMERFFRGIGLIRALGSAVILRAYRRPEA